MTEKKAVPSPIERVQHSFPKLKAQSAALNEVSDKLNDSAASFNAALKRLGLGITSWVEIDGGRDDNAGYYWHEDLGYAKVGGKWGLTIRAVSHECSDPEPDSTIWAFQDAPRSLRIKAAPLIPDLVDQLIEDAAKMTTEVLEHTVKIEALTEAILSIPDDSKEAR